MIPGEVDDETDRRDRETLGVPESAPDSQFARRIRFVLAAAAREKARLTPQQLLD